MSLEDTQTRGKVLPRLGQEPESRQEKELKTGEPFNFLGLGSCCERLGRDEANDAVPLSAIVCTVNAPCWLSCK